MSACQTCGNPIEYAGRGRPRKHCLRCKPAGKVIRPEEPEWVASRRNALRVYRSERP